MSEIQCAQLTCKSFIYAIDEIPELKCKENKRNDDCSGQIVHKLN